MYIHSTIKHFKSINMNNMFSPYCVFDQQVDSEKVIPHPLCRKHTQSDV